MVPCERYYHMEYTIIITHVHHESPITSGLEVLTRVKVFVHPSHADVDAGL